MFTICQLGGLNTLHTESQPAKHVIPGPSTPCLFFFCVGGVGGRERGRLYSPPRLRVALVVVSFQSTVSPISQSELPGWMEVRGEEGWGEVMVI